MPTNFCSQPFRMLDVFHEGYITCCGVWLSPNASSHPPFPDHTPWGVWNDPRIVRLRETVLDGSYSMCVNCPRLRHGLDDDRLPTDKPVMEVGPVGMSFSNDCTCNLRCPSCRPDYEHPDNLEFRRNILREFTSAFLPGLRSATFCLYGDPFASPIYREFLQTCDPSPYPDLRINLLTNGLLLPKYWPTIAKLHDRIHVVSMSVDAATKDTYEKVRLGGKWSDCEAAIAFLGKLRSEGRLPEFVMNFVVQESNFHEMPDFVRLGKDHGATRIVFSGYDPRAFHTQEHMRAVNVSATEHPRHPELIEILKDPMLSDPVVDMFYFPKKANP
jgi:sulfatase maturation enzyme AslB (radical SAM superfamily)